MFFFKQKTAYEMRISDWSSDVCSSDLYARFGRDLVDRAHDRLDRTLRIGLDDERIFDRLLVLQGAEHALEARRCLRRPLLQQHVLAIFGDLARTRFVLDDLKRIARRRDPRQPEQIGKAWSRDRV